MTPMTVGSLLLGLSLVAAGGTAAARSQNRPGEPGEAHVHVDNRAPNEAIPVAVENTPRVEVTGTPVVTLPTTTSVFTRNAQQQWAYRAIVIPGGSDIAQALGQPGSENWEAVGMMPGAAGGTIVLLKRPR